MLLLDGSVERENPVPRPSTFKRVLTLNGLLHHSKPTTNHNEIILLIRPTILRTPEVAGLLSKVAQDKMSGFKRAEPKIQTQEATRLKELETRLMSDRTLGKR